MTKMQQSDFVDTSTPLEEPKSREQRAKEWRDAHRSEYNRACEHERCTCTPTRAEALLMKQFNNPPID